jgi:hypothetical protein
MHIVENISKIPSGETASASKHSNVQNANRSRCCGLQIAINGPPGNPATIAKTSFLYGSHNRPCAARQQLNTGYGRAELLTLPSV